MALIGISGKINSGKDTIGKLINFHATGGFDTYTDLEGFLNYYDDGTDMYPFKIKKFADKLKDIVCILIGCTREQLEDREFKEKELGEEWNKYVVKNLNSGNTISPYFSTKEEAQKWEQSQDWYEVTGGYDSSTILVKMTPRLLLQLLGTDCGRQIIHPNIWINALMSEYVSVKVKDALLNKKTKEASDKLWKIGHLRESNWVITDVRFPNEAKAIKDRGGILIRINRPGLVESNHLSETSLDSATFDFVINNDKDIEHLINEVRKILEKLSII